MPWYAASAALAAGLVALAVLRMGAEVAVSAAQAFLSPAPVTRIAAVQRAQDIRAELPEMVEVHGTVTTDDDSAVPAGMCISILSHARAGNVCDMAELDADGRFKHLVRSGAQSVIIHPDGYAPALVAPIKPDVNGLLPEIKCVLSRGFTARVRVIDSAGKPIGGAAISSLYINDFYRGERTGKTGSDGIAALEHTTAALPAQVDVTAPGYEFARQTITFADGNARAIDVVDADGHPRDGISGYLLFEVQLFKNFCGERKTTDRDGSLTFEHVNPDADGKYFIHIDPGADYPDRDHFPVKVNGQPLAIKLPRVYTVKGQVLNDRTGKPLPHVNVMARPPLGASGPVPAELDTVTDDDGRFVFTNLEQSEYRLNVENTVPAGTSITKTPDGGTAYGWSGDLRAQIHGGQTQEAIVRVIPRGD